MLIQDDDWERDECSELTYGNEGDSELASMPSHHVLFTLSSRNDIVDHGGWAKVKKVIEDQQKEEPQAGVAYHKKEEIPGKHKEFKLTRIHNVVFCPTVGGPEPGDEGKDGNADKDLSKNRWSSI